MLFDSNFGPAPPFKLPYTRMQCKLIFIGWFSLCSEAVQINDASLNSLVALVALQMQVVLRVLCVNQNSVDSKNYHCNMQETPEHILMDKTRTVGSCVERRND